jgi:pimeloyl-ACP methyl ester carboxylesterase
LKGIPQNVQVLVVGGDEDYMTDKSALEQWIDEIGKNGNARCMVLVNVGHWGAIEEPEGVASALDELLST